MAPIPNCRYGAAMNSTIFVMSGGAIGAALRYHSGLAIAGATGDRWPYATLTVNLIGALAMGLLTGWALSRGLAEGWRLFIGVGLLGGFTTFSAFSIETWQLIERGDTLPALGYAAASVVGTVLLVGFGIMLTRGIAA